MGKILRKRAAMLLTAAMLAAVLPWGFLSRTDKAANKDLKLNVTKVDGTYKPIEIFTPNVEGNFKSIIFVNGTDGPKPQSFVPYIEQWMQEGYIEPMVVFMPHFYNLKTDVPVFAKEMGVIADNIKKGTYDESIGKTIDSSELSVCGYSMGGAVAGLAGCICKDQFINVGEFSPAPQLHYPKGESFYTKDYCPFLYEQKDSDCRFSTDPDKHLFMAVGSKDGDITEGIEYAYDRYGKDQGFAKMVFTGDEEQHVYPVFRKELFCFMYYIQNDTLPSDELIYEVFGTGYTIDKVMPEKTDSPSPTDTNTPTPVPTNTPEPTKAPEVTQEAASKDSEGSDNKTILIVAAAAAVVVIAVAGIIVGRKRRKS